MSNEFLPFGTGGGANVLEQADYSALPARLAGFIAGVAKSAEANKVWRQASSGSAVMGTYIDAFGFNALDNGDIGTLTANFRRSLRLQGDNYVVAGGTANALTGTFSPTVSANTAGLTVRVLIATANTGAATFNAGPGALPIVTLKGNTLEAGDLVPASIITLHCTGTAWMLVGAAYSEFRFRLKADMDLYCRPDGNDSNDGLSNTAGGAFRHPQAALDSIQSRYDVAGRTVNIHLADGTYNGFSQIGYIGSAVNLIGNVTTPSNVIIDGSGHVSGNPVGLYYGARINVKGIAFAGPGRIYVQSQAAIGFNGNCRLNNGTSGVPKITGDMNSLVYIGPGVALNAASGNAAALIAITSSSSLISYNTTFIDAGSVTYSDAAVVVVGSTATVVGTWGGSPTGKRYRVSAGLIFTGGAGASYIPGTVAGTSDETWMYQ